MTIAQVSTSIIIVCPFKYQGMGNLKFWRLSLKSKARRLDQSQLKEIRKCTSVFESTNQVGPGTSPTDDCKQKYRCYYATLLHSHLQHNIQLFPKQNSFIFSIVQLFFHLCNLFYFNLNIWYFHFLFIPIHFTSICICTCMQ